MSQGRPGGLTALAVVNFFFSLGCGIRVIGYSALAVAFSGAAPMKEQEQLEIDRMIENGATVSMFAGAAAFEALIALLLVLSGIGYLMQSRWLGRWFGNITATLTLLTIAYEASVIAPVEEASAGLDVIRASLLPLITLFLINVSFKEDFVK